MHIRTLFAHLHGGSFTLRALPPQLTLNGSGLRSPLTPALCEGAAPVCGPQMEETPHVQFHDFVLKSSWYVFFFQLQFYLQCKIENVTFLGNKKVILDLMAASQKSCDGSCSLLCSTPPPVSVSVNVCEVWGRRDMVLLLCDRGHQLLAVLRLLCHGFCCMKLRMFSAGERCARLQTTSSLCCCNSCIMRFSIPYHTHVPHNPHQLITGRIVPVLFSLFSLCYPLMDGGLSGVHSALGSTPPSRPTNPIWIKERMDGWLILFSLLSQARNILNVSFIHEEHFIRLFCNCSINQVYYLSYYKSNQPVKHEGGL